MKEYVTVPDRLLRNTKELRTYLDLSYKYISTLDPNHQGKNTDQSLRLAESSAHPGESSATLTLPDYGRVARHPLQIGLVRIMSVMAWLQQFV
jgi:hypothetical protein